MTASEITLPAPVTGPKAPDGWMSNSASLSDAALAVSGMNYGSQMGLSHFAGLHFVIDSAYLAPGEVADLGIVGIYRRSVLDLA